MTAKPPQAHLRSLLHVFLAALLLGGPGLAQNESGEDVRFRFRTAVDLVLVPVTIKDAQGNLVTDLKREEFRLFEDGQEQPIRHFSVDPFPLSAVILVDTALGRAEKEAIQQTVPVLAGTFSPEDEFSLFTFDLYSRLVVDFTRDAEQLRAALRTLADDSTPSPTGITGGPMTAGPRVNTLPVGPGVPATLPQARAPAKSIHDALFAAGLALRNRERGRRRVVFIISDGLNSRLNLHSLKETRDLLLGAEVAVYAVGVGNARFALGSTVLSDYARATGGDIFAPMTEEALAQAFARVTEQTRYQYTLAYAARPAPGGREYRRIEVRVRRPGLTLLARDGYFTGLPAE